LYSNSSAWKVVATTHVIEFEYIPENLVHECHTFLDFTAILEVVRTGMSKALIISTNISTVSYFTGRMPFLSRKQQLKASKV